MTSYSILTNKSGSTLMIVLLVLLVLFLLGTTLLNMTTGNAKITVAERNYQSIYYIAESGLYQQIEVMKAHMEGLYTKPELSGDKITFIYQMMNAPIDTPDMNNLYGQETKIEIKVEYIKLEEDVAVFEVISTGNIGQISRSVKAQVNIKWSESYCNGIPLTKENFSVSNWKEIQ